MQAARGTSLSGAGDPVGSDDQDSGTTPAEPRDRPTGASGPVRRRRARLVFVLVALALYAVDVVTKVLAVDRLQGKPDVPLVGDVLVLHLTRNPGAAFSTGTEYTVALSCVAIVAVVVVTVLSLRARSVLWATALGLLFAGVGGNLTDRLLREPGPLRGHVVDFLMLPNWPVFNIADICINVAAGLIIVQAVRGVRLDGSRTEA